jgi:hypothetical protein
MFLDEEGDEGLSVQLLDFGLGHIDESSGLGSFGLSLERGLDSS